VWEFYHYRREVVSRCRPNDGHFALAALQRRLEAEDRSVHIVTQNIDRLHQVREVVEPWCPTVGLDLAWLSLSDVLGSCSVSISPTYVHVSGLSSLVLTLAWVGRLLAPLTCWSCTGRCGSSSRCRTRGSSRRRARSVSRLGRMRAEGDVEGADEMVCICVAGMGGPANASCAVLRRPVPAGPRYHQLGHPGTLLIGFTSFPLLCAGTYCYVLPGQVHELPHKDGKLLRPAVVWFEECLDQRTLTAADEIMEGCDLLLVSGPVRSLSLVEAKS
jgi:hypothetical protein